MPERAGEGLPRGKRPRAEQERAPAVFFAGAWRSPEGVERARQRLRERQRERRKNRRVVKGGVFGEGPVPTKPPRKSHG